MNLFCNIHSFDMGAIEYYKVQYMIW